MPPNYRITGNIDVEVTLLTPQSQPLWLPTARAKATRATSASTAAAPEAAAPEATAPEATAPKAAPEAALEAQTIIQAISSEPKPSPGPSLWDRVSDLLWYVIGLASVVVVTFMCILAMAAVVDYFGIQDDFIWLFSAALLAAAILLRFPPMRKDIGIGDDLIIVGVILVATVLVWYFLASDKHVLMSMF